MPEPSRRNRPLARHRDVYTEADGLFGRLADLVIENPVRSGGFVTVLLMSGAIITNAAFFQTARHPDPFFSTRPESSTAGATAPVPAPAAATVAARPASPAVVPAAPAEAMPSEPQSLPPAVSHPPAESGSSPVRPKARPVASAPKNTTTAKPAAVPGDPGPLVLAGLVADTQRALAASNFYDGPVDGRLGPQTKAAISSFEMKIGLIPTGQPTPRLLQQIRRGYPPVAEPPVAEPASTGSIGAADPRLKRIQSALNDIGYGPIPEDGRDGAKTAAAIRHFEIDNRLPPTGRASDALAAKLVLIGAMPST